MGKLNLKTFFKILLSILLISFLVYTIDVDKLSEIKPDLALPFFLCVLISLIAITTMALRWGVLLESFHSKSVGQFKLTKFYFIGAFFNIFLPGSIGGDVVRTRKLSKASGSSFKSIGLITVSERLFGIYSLIILIAISLLVNSFPISLNNFIPEYSFWLIPVILILLIPAIHFGLRKFKINLDFLSIIKVIFLSIIAQFGDIIVAFILSVYFDTSIDFKSFIFIMPIVYMATVLPISLGGLGVREGTFSGLMALYGVDVSIAILISLIMYLVKVSIGILGYFIYIGEKDKVG